MNKKLEPILPKLELDPQVNFGFYIIKEDGSLWYPVKLSKTETGEITRNSVVITETWECKRYGKL